MMVAAYTEILRIDLNLSDEKIETLPAELRSKDSISRISPLLILIMDGKIDADIIRVNFMSGFSNLLMDSICLLKDSNI